MQMGPALDALLRLNGHARTQGGFWQRRAIYAYKTAAAAILASDGAATVRLVTWTGTCNRCDNGRFQHWSWDDGYTVACRDCSGTGVRTLRFTETTLPLGHVWHHPWWVGDGRGFDVARRAIPGLQLDDEGRYADEAGTVLTWHAVEGWTPNQPGQELALADLVPLLNTVEDWVAGLALDDWLVRAAKSYLARRAHRAVTGEPSHNYRLDLGRAPGGCFVCGSNDLASSTYGRITPLLHWSLPVCERHARGPEKAAFPKDPPPDALLTDDIRAWLKRHERVEVAE